MRKPILWLALSSLLAGCADAAPTRPDPEPPVQPSTPHPPLAAAPDTIHELLAVAAGADRLVAVGTRFLASREQGVLLDSSRPVVALSGDGLRWERVEPVPGDGTLFDVAHGGGVFVAVGGRTIGTPSSLLLVSSDATSWRGAERAPARQWRAVEFGGGRFLASAVDPASLTSTVAASVDGLRWEIVAELPFLVRGIAHGAGVFVAYGESGRVATSADGREWIWSTLAPLSRVVGLRFLDGRFVASGLEDCCYGEAPEQIRYFSAFSPDGSHWEVRARPSGPPLFALASGPGALVGLAHDALLASRDGIVWTRTLEVGDAAWRLDVVFAGGRFVVVGRGGINVSEDGRTWRGVSPPW